MNQEKDVLQREVLDCIDLCKDITDEELADTIDRVLLEKSKVCYIDMREKQILKKNIFNSIRKLDILQELIEDTTITEIMVNGPNKIFIEQAGAIFPYDKCFESEQKLEDVVQQIVAHANRIINEANPIVDSRLADGSRVNIILPPVAIEGPIITIRKFPGKPITMEQLLKYESITAEAVKFLRKLVISGYNILY
jgi:pilus assembly protein CpaF